MQSSCHIFKFAINLVHDYNVNREKNVKGPVEPGGRGKQGQLLTPPFQILAKLKAKPNNTTLYS